MKIEYGEEYNYYGSSFMIDQTREDISFYVSLFPSRETSCYDRILYLGKLHIAVVPVKENNDGVYVNIAITVLDKDSIYKNIYLDISKEALVEFMKCKISFATLMRNAVHMTGFNPKETGPERHIINREEVIVWLDNLSKGEE